MTPESQTPNIGEAPGLAYFGKMTATMSHELKNCLAIMNENAGLIQDLLMMNQSGHPLEPDRLDRISGGISRQVLRADTLLKQMNIFAHSVDLPEQQVDLKEAVRLAATIGARLAANQQVEILPDASDGSVPMTLSFFSLLNLIWQTLEAVMTAMAPKTILDIQVSRDPTRIRFTSSKAFESDLGPGLLACGVPDLVSRASARIVHDTGTSRVDLIFGEAPTKK